ncbi:zeta toxin family protein [Streptomyces sp. NPDC060028]|uniref:zeta toxin family protein n=1 Tax=Streptomyces sp. NPDC060028 TaxID=3347041 RepID=UPI0036A68A2F
MVATLTPGTDNPGAVGLLPRGQNARESLGPGRAGGCRARGLDAVVETALANVEETRAVSRVYRAAGHRIELVVIAVSDADSQAAVLERFFGPEGRYVGWDNQDACAAGLLDALAVIEAEHLVDRVTVVRRGLEPLYDNELTADGAWARPPDAVGAVRTTRVFRGKLRLNVATVGLRGGRRRGVGAGATAVGGPNLRLVP